MSAPTPPTNPSANRFTDADTPIRVCGVPDHYGTGDNCRWPDGDISYAIIDLIPGCPYEQYVALVDSVLAHIASKCGIDPHQVETARDARIRLYTHSFDGSGGVLADSGLPCGNVAFVNQRYDVGEKWHFGLDRPAKNSGKIWAWMVILHEILHALGIGHAPAGVVAVIAPMYNPNLDGLQPYDVQQLVRRYGQPKQAPKPPSNPSVPTPSTPTTPTPTTPTPTGGTMSKILVLVQLLQQLGPIIELIKTLADKAGGLSGLLDNLKAIADVLTKLNPPSASVQALTAGDLRTRLGEAAQIARVMAAWTPNTVDDAIAEVLTAAVNTDWLLDLLARVMSGELTAANLEAARVEALQSA